MAARMFGVLALASCVIASAGAGAGELNLPELLRMQNGEAVSTPQAWARRRAEILELFRQNVYGRAPVGRPELFPSLPGGEGRVRGAMSFQMTESDPKALDGKATRKQVTINYSGPGGAGAIRLLLFVPNERAGPVPAFVLLCNRGAENIDPTRAKKSPFWPAELIVSRGYAAAAFLVADVDPDSDDGFKNGVHGIFDAKDQPRPPDAWATIAGWAWGGSRAMDYFETDKDIDAARVAVIGHSRGGKTALWCGAQDERFALAISNDSGCTGAAIARNKQGERIKDINTKFPHWFCENYKKFNGKEDDLPLDQHMLIALMAPRPVCVGSASLDTWADPGNEFLACVHASPAWQLFGLKGLAAENAKMPAAEQPIQDGTIAYHLRTGKHDLIEYDWRVYLDFADKRLRGEKKK